MDEDLAYWLALNKIPAIGAKRFAQLIARFGSARAAWHAPAKEIEESGIGPKAAGIFLKMRRRIDPAAEMDLVAREGVRAIARYHHDYPRRLAGIPDPPPIIMVRGTLAPRDEVAVAIVGTRTASPAGILIAENLAAGLARQGVTIVSGMARGIDTAAHRGALAAGGRTIAVLGSGIDVIYPPENAGLYQAITEGGAVVSEFPLGTAPLQMNFPARNRVISGLSLGVVVVEAAWDSGSLITAGHALEQGREVFAVPGPLDQDGSRGPNRLIKQGAKLIESVQDILEELSLPNLTPAEIPAACEPADLTPEEAKVLDALTHDPRHVDLVVRDTGLASGTVGAALVMLEVKGLARQWTGGLFSRVR